MKIESIVIKNISADGFNYPHEGVKHIKTLPNLSVVQSVKGRYEIGLNGEETVFTDEGGAFIAPSGVRQEIIHHDDKNGTMEAQWVFMNVIINDIFSFEDVFKMPVTISGEYKNQLIQMIGGIRESKTLCKKYEFAYKLCDFLMEISELKNIKTDSSVWLIKRYVEENYKRNITKEELSRVAACSVAGLYRIFSKNFGMSPHNYINKIRLEKASVLLQNSNLSVREISETVGFEDFAYFSKLFKVYYSMSPKKYRDSLKI